MIFALQVILLGLASMSSEKISIFSTNLPGKKGRAKKQVFIAVTLTNVKQETVCSYSP